MMAARSGSGAGSKALSIAWLLLVFFVFALLAYVVMRAIDLRQGVRQGKASPPPSE